MGHGHGPPAFEVPDYRIYKVEDCPKLLKVQQRLAEKGLSDPWLRNEVWRFKESPSVALAARTIIFRGFGVGLSLFGLTLLYDQLTKSTDGHSGHGSHGGHH